MADSISTWCEQHLGARPERELFRKAHLSEVIGLALSDGREVVIKIRSASPRLEATTAIQRLLHARGFPCPAVLAGPAPFDGRAATAEAYLAPSGEPPDHALAQPVAELLAQLVDLAPHPIDFEALNPAPPWVGWDHGGPGIWPWPDDLDLDMNDHPGPAWLDNAATRVRDRLCDTESPYVIGHIDWEAHNLDWRGDQPVVVHDWDSLAIRPEPAIAGVAAATFTTNGRGNTAATVADTAAFLDTYARQRPSWTDNDPAIAWCAGLWVLLYNAKKETLGGGTGYLQHLTAELEERATNAGL
ncbi:MAG: hypothetical protein V7636_926 [Actinomycetota bacterium]